MNKNKPDFYNDLEKIYQKIWELLDSGLQNRNAPFHIPVFICGKNILTNPYTNVKKIIYYKKENDWLLEKQEIIKNNDYIINLFYYQNGRYDNLANIN